MIFAAYVAVAACAAYVFAQDGIGTGSCGPRALPKYDLKPGEFEFTWILEP